ncbi:UNVERIFIED_CONTAM: hypothetical protein Sindi_2929000 [Sesamum indicum]
MCSQELQKTAAKQGKHRLRRRRRQFLLLPKNETLTYHRAALFGRKKWLKIAQHQQQNEGKRDSNSNRNSSRKWLQKAAENRSNSSRNCSRNSPKQQLKLAQNDGKTHRNTSKTMASCNPCKWLQIAAEKRPKQQQKSPKTAAETAENAETVLTLRWGLFSRQDDFKTQNHSVETMISRRENV